MGEEWEPLYGRVLMESPRGLPGSNDRAGEVGASDGALRALLYSNWSSSALINLHHRIHPKISSEKDHLLLKYHLKPLF